MIETRKLTDLRCVGCGNEALIPGTIEDERITCPECNRQYEAVLGVPFLGGFESDDLLGLIEISANISNRGKFGVNPETVESWERLLADYHVADDKDDFIKKTPEAQSPYFFNRYGEWQEISYLLADVDLKGLKVLDIGAGLGFDSHRLSMRGGDVTALEFSPILAEAGNINFPHIRWIGGFSHCLPFKNDSFDAVFCNAALHHMKNIPVTITEALRVLKVGGSLITTCDSFRPSGVDDDFELKIFDHNPTVLLGVNEGVPRFSEYVSVLQQFSNLLEVEVFTHTLHNGPSKETIENITSWKLDEDGEMLSQRSGSLALRVKRKAAWPVPGALQTESILSAIEFSKSLCSETSAMAKLASLMPDKYVDLPFEGSSGSKFELLNGWRLPKRFQHARIAYRRGRWFLKRPSDSEALKFDLKLLDSGTESSALIEVMLNGHKAASYHINSSKWTQASVDLAQIPENQVYAIEINRQDGDDSLDSASFLVRNRCYRKIRTYKQLSNDYSNDPRVYAVIPVFNRLHFTLECIRFLKNQTYKNILIIVADGGSTDTTVDTVRKQHPDVVVLESEKELWWTGAMQMGVEHAIDESNGRDGFVLMMNNDTQIPTEYVESLVFAAKNYSAAVGAVVVDSRDTTCILDAGEYIDWSTYSFPVNIDVNPDDQFRDDVDVLPGRGSLIPLEMIRTAGNVDAKLLPHYLADYEFFYRLKQHGFRLGVYFGTQIRAHIEETGIIPGSSKNSFRTVFKELFLRRSMTNVVDHWRFVKRHAPDSHRTRIQWHLIKRAIGVALFRTPLRPFFLPILWLLGLPTRILPHIKRQYRQWLNFIDVIRNQGVDVLCHPADIPSLIRLPMYFFVCPGPIKDGTFIRYDLNIDELLAHGILRSLENKGWYAFEKLDFLKQADSKKLRRLLWSSWNPLRKIVLLIGFIRTL